MKIRHRSQEHADRELHQNVCPNLTVVDIRRDPGFLRKFSPDGKYLIAFSADKTAVQIYEYQGCAAAGELLSNWDDREVLEDDSQYSSHVTNEIFYKMLKLKYVVDFTDGGKRLDCDCSLFTSDSRYLIVGAVSTAMITPPNIHQQYSNNEVLRRRKFMLANHTLYIIDIQSGMCSHSLNFPADKIILTNNQGICLYNNTLAVLSIFQQTIHILSIVDGIFISEHKIGRFCSNEDEKCYMDVFRPRISPSAFQDPAFNGLKHRMLVKLFQAARSKVESGKDSNALLNYYHHFDEYNNLRMWNLQLLDDDLLLIMYTHLDVVTLTKNESDKYSSVYVLYNIRDKKITAMYQTRPLIPVVMNKNVSDSNRNGLDNNWTWPPTINLSSQLLYTRSQQVTCLTPDSNEVEATNRSLTQLYIIIYITRSFGVIFEEYVVDQGRNLTLRCDSRHPVRWVREGRREDVQQFQLDGSLVLTNLTSMDSGRYTCSASIPTLTTVAVNEEPEVDTSSSNDTNGGVYGDTNSGYENATTEPYDAEDNDSSSLASSAAEEHFIELLKVNVKVRTPPLAVSNFYVRASTIIAVLVWEVMPNRTGGYAIRDFTAEMRKMRETNDAPELPWETIDPRHISPNARQLEIYHLIPNTTYEFRIWGNNQLGAGEIVTILATTQPRMEEKDLVRRIMIDAKNFDTRVWIAAVGIVMGTLIILSLGTCIVLYKECREPAANDKDEELDSLELVPNIILNPGFCDSDDQGQHPLSPPIPRTLPYNRYRSHGHDTAGTADEDVDDDEEEEEPMTFSRRMSIFFTGNTIKRI
uniref:Ig-like domain-containing protein n=1 Tax=Anopheles farauti TaxID=69004 RepID=A0A182QBW4_9DIPT